MKTVLRERLLRTQDATALEFHAFDFDRGEQRFLVEVFRTEPNGNAMFSNSKRHHSREPFFNTRDGAIEFVCEQVKAALNDAFEFSETLEKLQSTNVSDYQNYKLLQDQIENCTLPEDRRRLRKKQQPYGSRIPARILQIGLRLNGFNRPYPVVPKLGI
jgi:hypothetical protein